jgi:hypothetical protein
MKPSDIYKSESKPSTRETFCRQSANELLRQLWVESPDEIDLIALAHKAGELRIQEGGLENAEGRIVAPGKTGGTIRVKAGLNPGRRRFTIAHEIGHYILHPREGLDHEDNAKNFTIWTDGAEEAEANLFAAELLMPEFLFRPRSWKEVPSLALIDNLAKEFSTSTLATAFQFTTHTIEQVALVVSVGGKIKWARRSKDFWPFVATGALHPHSAAGEIISGKSGDTHKMVKTPAYAWLPRFANSDKDISEDSRYLEWYDCVVTLLWLDEDFDDD